MPCLVALIDFIKKGECGMRINKKTKLSVAVLVCFISLTWVSIPSLAVNDPIESGGVMVYSFDYDIFCEFIENPMREKLDQSGNDGVIISVFTKNITSGDQIKREIVSEVSARIYEGNDGELMIGKLPVFSSLIDFVNNKECLKKTLIENGAVGEIKDAVLLNVRNMPVTIWLMTDHEDYFITVDERFDDYFNRVDRSAYVYRFYSYSDYYDKFRVKNGKLFINGKDATEGNYVKVHYSGAYLPLRTVIEHLGAAIEWDTERNVAVIFYNNKTYVFDPYKFSLIDTMTETNILIMPPGGVYYYCKIIDNRIIMNNYSIQDIISLMGADAKINVDYDNLKIEIWQQEAI